MSESLNIGMLTRKGGAGKSTLTKLMASVLIENNRKVLVIDLDPNKDILNWWQKAEALGNYDERLMVRATTDPDELYHLVDQYTGEMDAIIIDTKGEGQDWADDLASVSDRLVIPCMLGDGDIDRTRETLEWHAGLKTRVANPSAVPPAYVILTRMPPSFLKWKEGMERPKDVSDMTLDAIVSATREFKPLRAILPERNQYLDMGRAGPLGVLLRKHLNGTPKERGLVPAYSSALAHASELVNRLIENDTMDSFDLIGEDDDAA